MSAKRPTPRLVLYMKPGCHLCEQAEADLGRLRGRQPHTLLLVDITSDAELMERYGLRIPVLAAAGCEYDAPLEAALLGQALTAAAQAAIAEAEPAASSIEPPLNAAPLASAGPASGIGARRHASTEFNNANGSPPHARAATLGTGGA